MLLWPYVQHTEHIFPTIAVKVAMKRNDLESEILMTCTVGDQLRRTFHMC